MSDKYFQADQAKFIDYLRRVITDRENSGFLIVSTPSGQYIQFMMSPARELRNGRKIPEHLYWEAVSNEFLPPELQISQDKVDQLRKLQFTNEPNREFGYSGINFYRIIERPSEATIYEIVRDSCDVFVNVYSCDPQGQLKFELEAEI